MAKRKIHQGDLSDCRIRRQIGRSKCEIGSSEPAAYSSCFTIQQLNGITVLWRLRERRVGDGERTHGIHASRSRNGWSISAVCWIASLSIIATGVLFAGKCRSANPTLVDVELQIGGLRSSIR
jgi:hypothetical protein